MRCFPVRWIVSMGAALVVAGPAWADESAAAPEVEAGAPTTVKIDLQVISASTAAGEADPRLARVQKRLKDFNFASYRIVSERSLSLGLKSRETLDLPGGRKLEIQPRKFEKSGRVRVHLHLRSEKNSKLIDTDYAVDKGGDLLVGGPKTEDGSTLLVFLHHGS